MGRAILILGEVDVVVVVGEVVDGGAGRGVVVGEGRPEERKVGGEQVWDMLSRVVLTRTEFTGCLLSDPSRYTDTSVAEY